MSATSFAGVVFLIGMTVYANMTRQARIDENREYIKGVIEKQVYQSIQLTICLLYTSPSPRDRG